MFPSRHLCVLLPQSSSRHLLRAFSTTSSRYPPKRAVHHYEGPELDQVLPFLPPGRMTIVAYRFSKDFAHYAHAELIDSTSTIRILDSRPLSLVNVETTKPNISNDEASDIDETPKRRKGKHGRNLSPSAAYSTVAHILGKSPTADAYVVERVPRTMLGLKDRSMALVFVELDRYSEILRTQLVAKWRKEHIGDEESAETPSRLGTEPIFTTHGRFAESLFRLRKADTVCESLIPIVNRLPSGYETSQGLLRAELSPILTKMLSTNSACDEMGEIRKNLLCAAILESVAFSKFLLDARANAHADGARPKERVGG